MRILYDILKLFLCIIHKNYFMAKKNKLAWSVRLIKSMAKTSGYIQLYVLKLFRVLVLPQVQKPVAFPLCMDAWLNLKHSLNWSKVRVPPSLLGAQTWCSVGSSREHMHAHWPRMLGKHTCTGCGCTATQTQARTERVICLIERAFRRVIKFPNDPPRLLHGNLAFRGERTTETL